MSSDANGSMRLLWECAWQTTLILGLGGSVSFYWNRRPARAHCVLLIATVMAGVTPLLSFGVRYLDWGLLPPKGPMLIQRDVIAPASADSVAPSPAERMPATELPTPAGDLATPSAAGPAWKTTALSAADLPTTARTPSGKWPLYAWSLLSILVASHLLGCVLRGRRLLARARPLNLRELQEAARVAASKLNLAEPPAVMASADVRCPVIWCWRKPPVLLLPAKASAGPAPFDWVGILCHELAHWKRRDHWAQLAAEALTCLIPWQPLVWWTRRRLATLSEHACDDWAVAAGLPATDYAQALLRLVPQPAGDLALAALRRPSTLMRRMRHVLCGGCINPRTGFTWGLAISIAAAGISGAIALAQRGAPRTDARSSSQDTPHAQPAQAVHELEPQAEQLREADWRTALAIGHRLAALPPDQGYELLRQQWKEIAKLDSRQQLLRAWFEFHAPPPSDRFHARILDVLHLGATDPSPQVQSRALQFLRSIAFEDFSESYPAYLAWHERFGARPIDDVLRDNCRSLVERLTRAVDADRPALARLLSHTYDLFRDSRVARQTMLEGNILEVLAGWLHAPDLKQEVGAAVCQTIGALSPSEEYLRRVIVPLTKRGASQGLRLYAIPVLGGPQNKWAVDHLEQLLVQCLADPDEPKRMIYPVAQTLASIDDPRVIPTMIGVIAADNTYDTVYGVGYFGLGKLTGVDYDEKHDGDWWRQWWETNKLRFPQALQERPIPVLGTTHEPGGG